MTDNPGGKFAHPALQQLQTRQNNPKKGRARHLDDHLKERETSNKIKGESGEVRGGATEQKQGEEGAVE